MANELNFNQFTARITKELSSLNAKFVEKRNSFMFFIDSPISSESQRLVVTGHKPHGVQEKKGWPAWRHAFKKMFEKYNIGKTV